MDYKDDKILSHNTIAFLEFELENSGSFMKDPNHFTYMFDDNFGVFFVLYIFG